MNIRRVATSLLGIGLLFPLLVLAETPLIGVTGDGGSNSESLFSIDLGNASATFLTGLGNGDDGEVIVFNPADGKIYHLSGRGDVATTLNDPDDGSIFESVLANSPYTVVPITFQGLAADDPTFAEEALSAAYNINTGEILVTDLDGFLYSVTTTGQVRLIADLGFTVKGLAFHGSTLYALEQFDSFNADGEQQLLVLNPNTGAVISSTTVSLAGVDLDGRSNGLAVHPVTGQLVAIVQDNDDVRYLVTIDPGTGVATNLGVLDDRLAGITFIGFFGIADLFADSLIEAGSAPLDAGDILSQLPLHGAHHRPLLVQPALDGDHCVWLSGDAADYRRGEAALVEVGACHDLIKERLRFGIGLGKSFVNQDMTLGGDSDADGEYIISEVNYRFANSSLIGTLNFLYGSWDTDVNRHYSTFNGVEESQGNTDVDAWAGRIRLDWYQGLSWQSVSITPRIEFTVAGIDMDGYTETGGTFPVTFDNRYQTTREFRGGMDMEMPIGNSTTLVGMVEAVHRLDGDDPDITGTIIGQAFMFPGNNNDNTWARIGLGVEHLFSPSMLVTANVNGSSRGEDPRVSGGITLRIGF